MDRIYTIIGSSLILNNSKDFANLSRVQSKLQLRSLCWCSFQRVSFVLRKDSLCFS